MNNAAANVATVRNIASGLVLSYSPRYDARVTAATMSGTEVALVSCRSVRAANELAREAQAWGFVAEVDGHALKVAAGR